MIDAKATETEIKEWKNHPSVKRCYKNLFKKVNNEETNMSMIIDKAWKENFKLLLVLNCRKQPKQKIR